MFLKSAWFAGRRLQDFIISWQRNLSPCSIAVKIPELKVHIQWYCEKQWSGFLRVYSIALTWSPIQILLGNYKITHNIPVPITQSWYSFNSTVVLYPGPTYTHRVLLNPTRDTTASLQCKQSVDYVVANFLFGGFSGKNSNSCDAQYPVLSLKGNIT